MAHTTEKADWMHQIHLDKEMVISSLFICNNLCKQGSDEELPIFLTTDNKIKAFKVLTVLCHS